MSKKSYNFYLTPEENEMIDASLVPADASSRSEFVEKAIRYYAASLGADMHKEILSEELIRVIRDNIKNAENHIASTLFKMAGEQAVLSLLFADRIVGDIDRDELRAYRNDAYNAIRRLHGVFMFEDALDNAEAEIESED
ncbi:hypothetical protein IKP13_07695 [bacterium]|nr:hypothetical protein [bacterium]